MADEGPIRRPVVSHTSPIISLAAGDLLHLLERLYGEVLVPVAVSEEYEAGRRGEEAPLEDLSWIIVVSIDPDPVLPKALDPGEPTAIALALRTDARALLLDERIGRRAAAQLGLPIVGTVGVLLRAKQVGAIATIRPALDDMISKGVRISPSLRSTALQEAGEATKIPDERPMIAHQARAAPGLASDG